MLGTVCTGSACPSRRHAVARPAGGLARAWSMTWQPKACSASEARSCGSFRLP